MKWKTKQHDQSMIRTLLKQKHDQNMRETSRKHELNIGFKQEKTL